MPEMPAARCPMRAGWRETSRRAGGSPPADSCRESAAGRRQPDPVPATASASGSVLELTKIRDLRAARLDLRQLEVVAQVHQPGEVAVGDQFIQIRVGDRPTAGDCAARKPGGIGERAATSHWLPRRSGPRMAAPGAGRADSADCHSLAIPLGGGRLLRRAQPAPGRRPSSKTYVGCRRQPSRATHSGLGHACAAPSAASPSREIGQLLQRRFDLLDESGGHRGRRLARYGGMVLHAQVDQPRSGEQHHDQHHHRGQPPKLRFRIELLTAPYPMPDMENVAERQRACLLPERS